MVPEIGGISQAALFDFNRDTNSRSSFKALRHDADRDQFSIEDRETYNYEAK
jgi:hypothetical protein